MYDFRFTAMDLKYVVMIIIKILISVPTAMLITTKNVNGVALMGGHLDNKNTSAPLLTDYELYDDQESHDTNPTVSWVFLNDPPYVCSCFSRWKPGIQPNGKRTNKLQKKSPIRPPWSCQDTIYQKTYLIEESPFI